MLEFFMTRNFEPWPFFCIRYWGGKGTGHPSLREDDFQDGTGQLWATRLPTKGIHGNRFFRGS